MPSTQQLGVKCEYIAKSGDNYRGMVSNQRYSYNLSSLNCLFGELSFLDTRILYLRCPADGGHAIDELGPEKNVGVVEHTVFE